jgi:stage III sporulation protein SpoIIIAA
VKDEELKFICNQIDSPFGQDNRVGIEGELHRISCIRNKQENIIGLTIRIGRYFLGNTYLISDLLFHPDNRHKSILVVGPPGSGKTSLIREIARQLAEKHNVMIVDTSNEISGDSDVPHSCVGRARRMMVRDIEQQAQVMIECVQNHTPDIMIIDEIGRPKEVKAAKTCKERGVRLIASAHGDFRKLLKNSELNGLLGGVEVVTLGDESAKKLNHGNKLSAVRAGAPTFDIVVQVEKGQFHLFKVIKDTGHAVDKILAGEKGKAELRERKLEFIHRPFPTQEEEGEEEDNDEEEEEFAEWERDWTDNIPTPPPPHSPPPAVFPAEKDRSVNIPSLQQAKSQLLSFSFIEI